MSYPTLRWEPRSRPHRSAWLVVFAVLALAPAARLTAGDLSGRVEVRIEGLSVEDAGAMVVFLEASSLATTEAEAPLPTVTIRQQGASFEPDFLTVAVGQTIEMPNDDIIYHNVFSYSKPNDFDLGLYASGEAHSIRFGHHGLVRIYCSIHDEMDGLIFVAPTRHHAIADREGRYSIPDVPIGRYRIHVWSERLPEFVRPLEVEGDGPQALDLEIGIEERETRLGSAGLEEG